MASRDLLILVREKNSVTPYVVIDATGITIITPRAEMGQGIHTTLAALVAEELDVPIDQIKVDHGPASEHYATFFGWNEGKPQWIWEDSGRRQFTAIQMSIRDGFVKMRKAGSAARLMLLEAAAKSYSVPLEELSTQDGNVVLPNGELVSYIELAPLASEITAPEDPPLKPQSQWRYLGVSQDRVDMKAKCLGTAEYGIDVQLPDLLYATVKRNPNLGARMLSYDAKSALGMRGIEGIVPLNNGIIIVATNTWYAFNAAETISVEWERAHYPETTEGHRLSVNSALEEEPYYIAVETGDVKAAFDSDLSTVEGTYRAPYLSHALMEPLNATAWLDNGRLKIWSGNQLPTGARDVGAKLSGLSKDKVDVVTTYMGGGFGRRFELDDVAAAVHACLAFPGRPVRVTYTREEDMTHDTYRPMASARFRAQVSESKPIALDLHLSAPSLFRSSRRRLHLLTGERDKGTPESDVSISMGAKDQPYEIPNHKVTAYLPDELLPVGWWRSVGESQNCFFNECILDEAAHAAGLDPLEMRLSMLKHQPSVRVLDMVAEMSNWGIGATGRARQGRRLCPGFGSGHGSGGGNRCGWRRD